MLTPSPPDSFCVNAQVAAVSLRGRKPENQDTIHLESLIAGHGLLALIADGVSACTHPQRASRLAIRAFRERFHALFDPSQDEHAIAQTLTRSLRHANDALYFSDNASARLPALLSTLSGLLIHHDRAHLFHTGDSRVYRYRRQQLQTLSDSHQHQRGADKGALSAALGADATIEMQYQCFAIAPQDIYLLTTDGIHDYVADEEITLLLRHAHPQKDSVTRARYFADLPEKLCCAAEENASPDNLSCIVIGIEDFSRPTIAPRALRLPPALAVGETLDQFSITRILHHTARSSVYLARDPAGNARVLKVPSPYFEDDPNYLRRFLKEEKIGLGFDHPGLLRFYPRAANSHYLYHISESIPGTTLREFLDEHAPLNLALTRELIGKIALALRVMHRNYYLHQDLKPENILITPEREIVLIDFGSVGSLILKETRSPPVGDLHYSAPEYYRHAPKGVSADLFSLAVIAYEMLTGQRPFAVKALTANTNPLPFPDLLTHNPKLPYWLNDVFARALHPDPQARYQALGDFLNDLDPAGHALKTDTHHSLLERNPTAFWKGVSLTLLILLLLSLFLSGTPAS